MSRGLRASRRSAAAAAVAAAVALLAACRAERAPRAEASGSAFTDRSPHEVLRVRANGVELATLDWGGQGPPLIMLHGIGDNPHIFDDLADRLRNDFRVVAYARRGHGASDAPEKPYDLPTLVEDLRQLMDALEIRRASLLGWSMGGNEITRFAGLHPDRVDKLVYIDSGFDWSDPAFLEPFGAMLEIVAPDPIDLASLDAYRNWFRESWLGDAPWSPGLEAYLRDTVRVVERGKLKVVPNDEVFAACFASLSSPPRDYAAVRAPVLAIYAATFFPTAPGDPSLAAQAKKFEKNVMVPFRAASRDRIRRELPGARIEEIDGTTHMSIGVEETDALATLIRDFLKEPVP